MLRVRLFMSKGFWLCDCFKFFIFNSCAGIKKLYKKSTNFLDACTGDGASMSKNTQSLHTPGHLLTVKFLKSVLR